MSNLQLQAVSPDVAHVFDRGTFWSTIVPGSREAHEYAIRHRVTPLILPNMLSQRSEQEHIKVVRAERWRKAEEERAGKAIEFRVGFETTCEGASVDLETLGELANKQYPHRLVLNQYRRVQITLGPVLATRIDLDLQPGSTTWRFNHLGEAIYIVDRSHFRLSIGEPLYDFYDFSDHVIRTRVIQKLAVFDTQVFSDTRSRGIPIQRLSDGTPEMFHVFDDKVARGSATPMPFGDFLTRRREELQNQSDYYAFARYQRTPEYQASERAREARESEESLRSAERNAIYMRALVQALTTTGRMSDIPRFIADPGWYERTHPRRGAGPDHRDQLNG